MLPMLIITITDIFELFFSPIFKCQKWSRDAETITEGTPEPRRPTLKPTGAQNKVYPVILLTYTGIHPSS